jgi:hypothetical protein
MELQENKYLKCLTYFFLEKEYEIILQRVKITLNDPSGFYYNYDADNIDIRCKNLFKYIFNKYVETINGQHYKALWHLLHIIPIIMCNNNHFVKYFYKTFIFENIDCVNCISHYIMNFIDKDDTVFSNSYELFILISFIHNEINEYKEKSIWNTNDFRIKLTYELKKLKYIN